ncbi:MAG TPA: squalene synthase HpnC [Acidimicrobiales bacterium]|nr:squalene synthase HpnC [Acidimicrobiales bacterium]
MERMVKGHRHVPREVTARARQENFPVASRLLPQETREALMAFYGFARLVDDSGDEAPGDRLGLLAHLEAQLDTAVQGAAQDPTFQRLAPVIRGLGLDATPFRRLIEANRLDQRKSRYQTWDELVDYCMLSAAPVGELVLGAFRATSPERVALSDDVCIALQLVEHLQDVGEDVRRDRVYLPVEDMERFGCRESDLTATTAGPALRALVAFEAARARRLLTSGVSLAATLSLRPRVAICGFVGGGLATIDSMRRADYDVLSATRRPTKPGVVRRTLSTLALSTRGHG